MGKNNSKTKLLVLVMLMFLVSQARGIEHLTINGEDVDSIDLSVGQNCTIEVVSDGVGMPYIRRLALINFSVSDLELLEIKSEAGTGASATPGATYYTLQAETGMVAGVHFVFGYTATVTGQKGVELRYIMGGDPIDSIVINVSSAPAGTAFTYQGQLSDGDSVANGDYDFEFKLYNSPTAGDQFGLTVNKEDVSVDQGIFTVKLDFVNDPNVFNGEARWLEIGVRPGAETGAFTMLSPRQELTPTPYALHSMKGLWNSDGNDIYYNAGNVGIGTSSPAWELQVANLAEGDGAESAVTADSATGAIAAYSGTLGVPYAHYAGRVSLFSDGATMGLDLRADSIIGDMRFYTGGPWPANERMRITESGDIDVSNNRVKKYHGFPKPDYNSGWLPIDKSESFIHAHNLGGDVDNYVVDVSFKAPHIGLHHVAYGGDGSYGASWSYLSNTQIRFSRRSVDSHVEQIRIRIWVYD